jgi:hypothetical protein
MRKSPDGYKQASTDRGEREEKKRKENEKGIVVVRVDKIGQVFLGFLSLQGSPLFLMTTHFSSSSFFFMVNHSSFSCCC